MNRYGILILVGAYTVGFASGLGTDLASRKPECPECGEVTQELFDVRRVIDGDTFVIDYDGEPTSVRLWGIDAPERNKPGGIESTRHLRHLLDDEQVALSFPGRRKRDNFGRLLAVVERGGMNINNEMIRSGHAVALNGR